MDTTQEGVSAPATPEAQFQSLWDAGAFEPQNPDEQTQKTTQQATQQANTETAPEVKAPEGQQAAQKQEGETPPGAQAEEKTYNSLDEYLAEQKIDPEDFKTLPVTVKIDGQEKQVPLSEVLKSYQLEGHVNNKSIQLSEQQKQFETEAQAARALFKQQAMQYQALGQYAQNLLNHDFQSVNWNELRASNPAEYAARFAEFQQRQNSVNQYLAGVQQQQAQLQQVDQQEMAQRISREQEAMLNARPEWRDPQKFQADRDSMAQYALSRGFSQAELAALSDHRLALILHDAARFAGLQAAKPEALKKVRAAPNQTAKPGTRNIQNPDEVKRSAAAEAFLKNPMNPDAAAAYFEFLL